MSDSIEATTREPSRHEVPVPFERPRAQIVSSAHAVRRLLARAADGPG